MNQFKKAKQLRMESGQTTESITDLKTAGITPENKNESSPNKNTSSNEKKSDINTSDNINEISSVIQDISQSELQEDISMQKQSANTISPSETGMMPNANQEHNTLQPTTTTEEKTAESVSSIINNIEETVTMPQTSSITMESQTPQIVVPTNAEYNPPQSDDTTLSNSSTVSQPILQSFTEPSPISQPVTAQETLQPAEPLINSIASVTPIAQTSTPIINEAIPPVLTVPAAYHNTPVPQTPVAPIIIEPSNEQQFHEPKYQEVSSPKQTKTTKKSAPNIFAPKSEAKSMRKSLVLKPTSVKIAENYCSKNGGSFNELIQTLLDNFIDEYGL